MTDALDGDNTTVRQSRRGRHRRPSTFRFGRLKVVPGRPATGGQYAAQPRETPPAARHTPAV